MRSLRFFTLVLSLCGYMQLTCGAAVASKVLTKQWPTCISQFCFDKQAPNENDLTKPYGKGIFQKEGEASSHCYETSEQKLFIKFTVHNDIPPFIDSVLVSAIPICEKSCRPEKSFGMLKTMEGLSIGDPYEKVLQLYGKPNYVKTGEALKSLVYSYFHATKQVADFDMAIAYGPNANDDLLIAWFFLKQRSVAAILISVSE